LIKIRWELLNERPGTKVFLEKSFNGDDDWTEVYSYFSNEKSSLKTMNYDDLILDSSDVIYRIRCVDPEGNETTNLDKQLTIEPVTDGFSLFQNSPNPFSSSTKIAFKLPVKSKVKIKLYNSRLEEIATILDDVLLPGLHELEFKPFTSMESGIYFYRMSAGNFNDVKKMIYTK
jgi:hypothetical protein